MQYTEQLGYVTVSLGEIVRRAYEQRGRPDESVAEFVVRTHAGTGLEQFAREAVADLNQQLSDRTDDPSGVVVEGIHSKPSARVVKETFGATDIVFIHAALSIRLRRLRKRDGACPEAELLNRDLRELNSGLGALTIPQEHEFYVCNNGALNEFERQLDVIFG
jgi:dephospho-CoA kinase